MWPLIVGLVLAVVAFFVAAYSLNRRFTPVPWEFLPYGRPYLILAVANKYVWVWDPASQTPLSITIPLAKIQGLKLAKHSVIEVREGFNKRPILLTSLPQPGMIKTMA